MPILPNIPAGNTTRVMTDTFRGYNHNLKIADGEFYDTENLTTYYYPILSNRAKRGTVRSFTRFQGMTELNDKLAWVDNGKLYYDGTLTPVINLSTGEKQLVTTGAYICIFPDQKYYNTVNPTDSGDMTHSMTINNANLVYKMSNSRGVEYGEATKSDTKPSSPTDGQLWIDTKYNKLMVYSTSTTLWSELTDVYTKIIIPSQSTGSRPSDLFREYDAVTVEGSSIDGLNGSKVLYAVGDNYVVVVGILDNEITDQRRTLKMYQTIPDMDFVIECQNRLWGCKYGQNSDGQTLNEIYCCALGDFRNWNRYLGISTDSWTASVGTDGPWTGAVNYLGYPTFFKADHIHRVSVSAIGAHQIQDTPCRGVQPGSSKSISIINETLYYKARESICAYQGGFPTDISSSLGEVMYHDAVGGSYGDRYYLSMLDADNHPHLFCVDLKNGLWMREDDLRVSDFVRIAEELYAASGNKLIALRGSAGTLESRVNWYAETGMQTYEQPDKKYLSRYNIRLKMEKGARLKIFIEYDSDGYWHRSGEIVFSGTNTVTVPIRPRRCDHLRMRLEGNGEVKIFSIARILEVGSDI